MVTFQHTSVSFRYFLQQLVLLSIAVSPFKIYGGSILDLFFRDVASVDKTACVVDLGSGESDLVRTESMCNISRLEDPNAKRGSD